MIINKAYVSIVKLDEFQKLVSSQDSQLIVKTLKVSNTIVKLWWKNMTS